MYSKVDSVRPGRIPALRLAAVPLAALAPGRRRGVCAGRSGRLARLGLHLLHAPRAEGAAICRVEGDGRELHQGRRRAQRDLARGPGLPRTGAPWTRCWPSAVGTTCRARDRPRHPELARAVLPLPTDDFAEYGRLVGELAQHARGVIDTWEILNEPDGSWFFEGTAQDYARMLNASYDAVKLRFPGARVALGESPRSPRAPGSTRCSRPAGAGFEIANIHVRGDLGSLAGAGGHGARSSRRTASAVRCGSPSTAIRPMRPTRPALASWAVRRRRRRTCGPRRSPLPTPGRGRSS